MNRMLCSNTCTNYNILQLIIQILMLVRSMREANFVLLVSVLQKLTPYFFATDHTNYARWLPVFIHDLETLPVTNPDLYSEFKAGKFAVQSTNTEFSKMAFDQSLEQNNKKIKATNGYINVVNTKNEKFLRMLEVCTPEIQEYLEGFGDNESPAKHKEAVQPFIKLFLSHCSKVLAMLQMNPYKEEQLKKINNTAFIFPEAIVNDAAKVFDIGLGQYDDFVHSRFVLGSSDVINTPIPRNGLKLPKDADKVALESPQIRLAPSILKRLEDACKVRKELALELFETEFTGLLFLFLIDICITVLLHLLY